MLHGAPAAGTRHRRPGLLIDISYPHGTQTLCKPAANPQHTTVAVDRWDRQTYGRSTVTRSSFDNDFDNDERHVTAFRPISEAAHSWSYDNHGRTTGYKTGYKVYTWCQTLLCVLCGHWTMSITPRKTAFKQSKHRQQASKE